MGMMFPHTITIYNKREQSYERSVIRGVLYQEEREIQYGKVNDNVAKRIEILIPHKRVDTNFLKLMKIDVQDPAAFYTAAGERYYAYVDTIGIYCPPAAFRSLEKAYGYWTLEKDDVIVFGETKYEVERSSRELFDRFDACRVAQVSIFDFGSQLDHLEVTCR